jgi:hypothetical protein
MIWTRLIYGTAICTALVGTAIYYSSPRAVIKPIDIVELHEAAYERLMPFGYALATNTVIYEQPQWTVDPSTNRWQLGTNQIPYLLLSGITTVTDRFVGVTGIVNQGEEQALIWRYEYGGVTYFWGSGSSVPFVDDFVAIVDQWTVSVVQTGRTHSIDGYTGSTSEVPAYVMDVHPQGVGVYNNKATLDRIDAMLIGVIPSYADHEQAVFGAFTNSTVPMLTVSSVWTRLGLPCIWTNISRTVTNTMTNWVDSWTNEAGAVTNVTRIGTNAEWLAETTLTTNFAFTTGQYCTTNMLWERFRVAQYLRWTPATWGWTNSVRKTWTNVVYSFVYSVDQYNTGGDYYYWLPEPPDFPAWWNLSGIGTSPSNTPAIDDLELGSSSTNAIANTGPLRSFTTSGDAGLLQFTTATFGGRPVNPQYYSVPGQDVIQGWGNAAYPWWDYLHYVYTSGHWQWGNNILITVESSPYLMVPYNITNAPVTCDLYTTPGWPGYARRILTNGIDMSGIRGSNWIGGPVSATNDIFAVTNYPYSGGYNTNGIGAWRVTWSASASTPAMTPHGAVLKWQFTRCPP